MTGNLRLWINLPSIFLKYPFLIALSIIFFYLFTISWEPKSVDFGNNLNSRLYR